MNAPLPEAIRKALEAATLDDNPRSGLRRRLTSAQPKLRWSHKHEAGAEGDRCVPGVERHSHSEA